MLMISCRKPFQNLFHLLTPLFAHAHSGRLLLVHVFNRCIEIVLRFFCYRESPLQFLILFALFSLLYFHAIDCCQIPGFTFVNVILQFFSMFLSI
ncbi:hypothetical protein DFH11DRAFT_1600240 [Phellopilus nigrolimitatus]|nr:hypothetical protein DFH11DRAFT_1600240 [Phellopilus nigrolimitatus]